MAFFLVALATSLSTPHQDYRQQDVNLVDIDWEDSVPDQLGGNGGAFSADNLSLLSIAHCQFVSCGCSPVGYSGGAGFIRSAIPFNVTIVDTTIKDCYANAGGGAFFFASAPEFALFSRVTFSNTSTYLSIGGALAFPNGCGCTQIDSCTFSGCAGNETGGALSVENGANSALTITNSQFGGNSADEGGAIYLSTATLLSLTGVTFTDNVARSQAVALSLSDISIVSVEDAQFSFDKAKLIGRVSVFLTGNLPTVSFVSSCFNSTVADTTDPMPSHIYGDFEGSITFQLPMCFDTTKEKSLEFISGQDPAGQLDIFNCDTCLPTQTVPLSPFPTETVRRTASSTVVATASPGATKSSSKLTTGEVVGISVGSVAIVILIIVVVILAVGVCGRKRGHDPLIPEPLLSSEPLIPPGGLST